MDNLCIETKRGMKIEVIEELTPQIAAELLTLNKENRNIRSHMLKQYVSDMKSGNWKSNGASIVIGNDGILKDGQHRLLACIQANVTLTDVILVYIPKEQANCFDLNGVRNAKNVAYFEGYTDVVYQDSLIISAVTQILKAKDNYSSNARDYSKMCIVEEITKNIDAAQFVREHISKRNHKNTLRKSSVIAAIMVAYNCGYPLEKLERFCEVYMTGVSLAKNEICIVKLRDYAMSKKTTDLSTQKDLYYRTQSALYSYEKNKCTITCRKSQTEFYTPFCLK